MIRSLGVAVILAAIGGLWYLIVNAPAIGLPAAMISLSVLIAALVARALKDEGTID